MMEYEALRLIHRRGATGLPWRRGTSMRSHNTTSSALLLRGAQIDRCASCDDEVAVQIDHSRLADTEPQG